MTTVMIAVDATDSSVRAVRTAHRLFGDDVSYLLLNVGTGRYVPVPFIPSEVGMISPLAWGPLVQSQDTAVEARADSGPESDVLTDAEVAEIIARQTGEEGGLPDATALGTVGDPASAIVDVAVEHAADLIVVGTHERGWLTRLLSPSIADEVRRASPIPVLVVPRPADDVDDDDGDDEHDDDDH
ncbi:MAG: universal stress protein [Ilumatobacteraceae bacterium]